MALLLGPIDDADLDTAQVVVQALRDYQPSLEPEHVQVVSQVDQPPSLVGPLWRWVIRDDDRPPVQDPDITVCPGAVEQGGRWTPSAPQAPAEIRSGLVVNSEYGMVVVGAHKGEDDDLTNLLEAATAHVAALSGAE